MRLFCLYWVGNVEFMCFMATIRIFMVFGLLAICLLSLNLVDIFWPGVSRRSNIWVSGQPQQYLAAGYFETQASLVGN